LVNFVYYVSTTVQIGVTWFDQTFAATVVVIYWFLCF